MEPTCPVRRSGGIARGEGLELGPSQRTAFRQGLSDNACRRNQGFYVPPDHFPRVAARRMFTILA